MDKKLLIQLNGSRKIIGVLRGYDVFLNLVLDEAVEVGTDGNKTQVGQAVVRGNSVVLMEALESVV